MSTVAEEFYGTKCDYPGCGAVFQGYESSYWSDKGTSQEEAREDGWLTDYHGHDYCPTHTVMLPAPDENDEHDGVRPIPDTWDARLGVALNQSLERIDRYFRWWRDRVDERFSPRGQFGLRTLSALESIHAETCKAWDPTVTGQQLFDLKNGRKR